MKSEIEQRVDDLELKLKSMETRLRMTEEHRARLERQYDDLLREITVWAECDDSTIQRIYISRVVEVILAHLNMTLRADRVYLNAKAER